jgi:phosphoglycerate dehydrogenase-like enzyme
VAPRLRVVLLGPSTGLGLAPLRELLGDSHDVIPEPAGRGPAAEAVVRQADVLVTVRVDRDLLGHATRLRLVQLPGAGTDGVDPAALPPGACLANAYEHEAAIGEFVLLQMLALNRELLRLDRAARAGDWSPSAAGGGAPHRELGGHTVGLVGYGRIGRAVARLARGFGMRVLAATRSPHRADPAGEAVEPAAVDALVGMDRLEWLIRHSQFLVVAVPLTPETRGLLGARELGWLGPEGYLVNVARGPIVDESALYEALRDHRIAGAAIDTWYRYPGEGGGPTPVAHLPFGELDNVLMTPHVAGWTEPTMRRRWGVVAANVERVARGEPPLNLVYRAPRPDEGRPGGSR